MKKRRNYLLRRGFALFMALAICLGTTGMTAFAAELEDPGGVETQAEIMAEDPSEPDVPEVLTEEESPPDEALSASVSGSDAMTGDDLTEGEADETEAVDDGGGAAVTEDGTTDSVTDDEAADNNSVVEDGEGQVGDEVDPDVEQPVGDVVQDETADPVESDDVVEETVESEEVVEADTPSVLNTNDTIDLGGIGGKVINFTIRYHSNYPTGANCTVVRNYTVKSFTAIYNIFSSQFLSYYDYGFGGFTPKLSDKIWYANAACTEVEFNIGATNGSVYDLYAGWEMPEAEKPIHYAQLVYDTDYPGYVSNLPGPNDLSSTENTISASVSDLIPEFSGYRFLGWAENEYDSEVKYQPGDSIMLDADSTDQDNPTVTYLYAVWKKEVGSATGYKLNREYYMDGTMVATVSGSMGGIVGQEVSGADLNSENPKWSERTIDGETHIFEYAGSDPEVLILSEDASSNVITLRYELSTKADTPETEEKIKVIKVFEGLDDIPDDFSIDWTAVNMLDGQYSVTKTLTRDNALSFDETTGMATWMAPHYYYTGGSRVTITEHCDVDGYTYAIKTSRGGSVNDNAHVVTNILYGNNVSGSTLTITNTYTPDKASRFEEVSYTWTGLPEDAGIKYPDTQFHEISSNVTVDQVYSKGQTFTYGEGPDTKIYIFSGWSTEDAEIIDGMFTMPDKPVVISGEWVQQEEPENHVLKVTAENTDVVYDGQEHIVDPVVTLDDEILDENAVITIAYYDEDGDLIDKPVNAGTYTAKISVDHDNLHAETIATVVIRKRPVEIITGSAEKIYDGTPLVQAEANITVQGGFVAGEEIVIKATGSQTEVGYSDNFYELDWGNADKNNYEIVKETLGVLTVKAKPAGGDPDPVDPDPIPTPDPDPDPDDPTPTTPPVKPVDPTPTPKPTPKPTPDSTPEPDTPVVNVPDPDVPLADTPEEPDDPDEPEVVITPDDPDEYDIPDSDVPLSDVPKTGDDSWIWAVTALISGFGIIILGIRDRKRKAQ